MSIRSHIFKVGAAKSLEMVIITADRAKGNDLLDRKISERSFFKEKRIRIGDKC